MKAPKFAASVAPVMFSPETSHNLERLAKTSSDIWEYIIGCLVFIATAAVHPEYLPLEKRLATFCGELAELDAEQKRWADAGFFLTPSTTPEAAGVRSASCFHCGARYCYRATHENQVDPIQLHKRCSQACELVRLLSFAIGSHAGGPKAVTLASSEEASSSAAKLRRAIAKLLSDLRSSDLLEHVESYGFARRLAAFCACRLFMRSRNGQAPARPGDLIQAMHDSEDLLGSLPTQLDVEAALKELGAPTQPATDAVAATTDEAPSQQAVAAEPTELKTEESLPVTAAEKAGATLAPVKDESSASEQCAVCRLRTRDQVTLPCAHFLLCRQCACERRNCPKCDKPILATLRAFIA